MPHRFSTIVASSGFGNKLGGMIDVEKGGIWVLSPSPELIGNPFLQALHGGAVTAFLQLACGSVVARQIDRPTLPRLISTNVQFLAPVLLQQVLARPIVRRVGRRVAFIHAEAWQDDPNVPVCAIQCEFSVSD